MSEPLVVVGAGGFGREALDVAEAVNRAGADPVWEVLGVVDDAPSEANLSRLERRDIKYLGPVESLVDGIKVSLGVGSPRARALLDSALTARGFEFATLVHPSATVGSQLEMGAGSIICAGVSLGTNVSLGRHVHLNPHAAIGHDAHLDDFVSVNPNATVSGDCVVEPTALIGAGAVVLQGLRVGSGATVGASACVLTNVAAGVTVVGVPARARSGP